MSEKTDEKIAKEVQGGNSQSFGVLVERYEEKLRRYAKRFLLGYEDVEDLIQDVFLKAYTKIQSFDTDRSFNAWIYRIAHNEFINAIKKKGKEPLPFFDPDTLFPHPLSKERPDHDLNDAETKSMLDEFLGQIDAKYREPLVLYYYEDMDYAGLAEIMRIPKSTVGVRIHRGKAQLQKIFKESKHSK